MKFFKLLRFDLKNGLLRRWQGYLILFATIIFAYIDFSIRIMEIRAGGIYGQGEVSIGTFLFYLFGGMEKYVPSPANPFIFPALWILVFIQILFITLYYPFDNLNGIGKNLLIASGRRKSWWLSKCIWNISSVCACFIIIWLTALVCTLVTGGELSFAVGPLAEGLFPKALWIKRPMDTQLFFYLIPAPLLVAAALSLVQMVVSLVIRPIFSFLCSAVLLGISIYYVSPAFIGNYAMAVRADSIAFDSVDGKTGLGLCLLIIGVSILFGYLLFGRYDILGKDTEK